MMRIRNYPIVFVDMRLPGAIGSDLIMSLADEQPKTHAVVVLTDPNDLLSMRSGIYFGVIIKPPTAESVRQVIARTKT